LSAPTDNQIYGLPANQFSPSAGTSLALKFWRVARKKNKENKENGCSHAVKSGTLVVVIWSIFRQLSISFRFFPRWLSFLLATVVADLPQLGWCGGLPFPVFRGCRHLSRSCRPSVLVCWISPPRCRLQ